ncbi:MAG: MarR family transcriptional regulator [Burkholderiaceae bacterium]|nr:MarR family transcriptional regulator [Burkholderiaceae bacterium]
MHSQHDGLGFLLAEVSRLMRREFAQRMGDSISTLTFAQARVLVHLAREEGLRQIELANLLEVQPITLARLVDQLDARGLVERRPDPEDRRAHRLFLTPAARPHLAAIRTVAASVRARALRDIDAVQAGALSTTLGRMRDNLATNAGDAARVEAR